MLFFRAERFVAFIIVALFAIDIVLIGFKNIKIDVMGYCLSIAIGSGLVLLGQIYRVTKRDEKMAAALIAAGLFILFSICGSVFNYMFLPVRFPLIDETLMRIDDWIGYDWARSVTWVASYPSLGKLLFFVYATALPQLLFIIIVLGFTGRIRQLHQFLVTGVLGALTSITFWVFFPTYSPSSFQELPAWIPHALPLALGPEYGRELIRLGTEGVQYLTPRNLEGLIGFPSFHIFMAAMSVYFVPRYRAFIVVIATLNLLMVPAALIQGAHHLSDVFGGLVLFAIVCPISIRLVNMMTVPTDNDSSGLSIIKDGVSVH
ncbi:hypothetical protein QE369_002555 [Agrobacterium larrymoorei]|uniref:Inositolphosphotransferase Aur1/Ipt1 domain-containing protein n=1 Tax=Agrobacterium larrymoorei TaxID=160699 RepID=A0AAJ2B8H6_9HYPH|nr:phosphatase PAP2 family protein [Agrobacterium larrymoorei]MDR6102358.1 hypothetical protein [Agrobacterium larrymoorei]